MDFHAVDYLQLGFLPKLIQDYLNGAAELQPFYKHPFNFRAFEKVIAERQFPAESRKVLVEALNRQYSGLTTTDKVSENIKKLAGSNTFTVTTAHQPVIFTGPLYCIYKIISTIHLAEQLQQAFPNQHFVPVYYIGAEDHDFDEINHIWLGGEKLEWQHDRRGAVGRMATHDLVPLIHEIESRLHGPYAAEAMVLLKAAFTSETTLAAATTHFINSLFGEYGLVVLNPDTVSLKRHFTPVLEDEVLNNRVFKVAEKGINKLVELGYDVQASPREINLFYLGDGFRERIVVDEATRQYRVLNTQLTFTQDALRKETQEHPERFSPNVMLRPLYQEMILPNLAYIGGAGELSYWLEQKAIFEHYDVNYPVLVLRNSAVLVDANSQKKLEKAGLNLQELFEDEETIVKNFVKKNSTNTLDFTAEKEKIEALFKGIREKAAAVDVTLSGAVEAQKTAVLNSVDGLEKKILKAEKRNFETATAQIKAAKAKLFPNNNLQERVENFLPYYAGYGKELIETLKKEFDPFRKEMVFVQL